MIALAGPLSHIPQGLFWLLVGAEMVPVCARPRHISLFARHELTPPLSSQLT